MFARSTSLPVGKGAKALAIFAAAAILVASLSAATHFIASVFNYQTALGAPLISLGDAQLYPPWAIFTWSQAWADNFPKPFAVAHLIVVCGFAGAVLIVAAALRAGVKLKPFGQSEWGTFEDAKAADLFANGGTILGKLDGEILAYDGPEHQLLIGASRSGKGRGQIVPTLLSWAGSAVVLDVKGELAFGDERHGFPGTSGFRASLGPTLCFAPTRPDSACYNFLSEVRRGDNEVRDVQNIVEAIVNPNGETHGAEAFWNAQAKIVLTGLVLHVLYAEPAARKNLATVREKLRDLDRSAEEMRTTLHRRNPQTNLPEVHPEIVHAADSYLAGEERLRSGIKATAESFFGIFADPIVAEKTASSDFRIADLMCGERPVTLFLQPPPSDVERLMPLMRLMLNQIARGLMESQTHA